MAMKYRCLLTKCPLTVLGIHQVNDPFGEEGRHVLIVAARTDEYLGVTCPAQSLITLRTVGGHL